MGFKSYLRQPQTFSWTWRWKKEVIEEKRKELLHIINRYISQIDKSLLKSKQVFISKTP